MSLRAWRTAHGCVAGTSHLRNGTPCQDAARCEVLQAVDGTQILLACVADGAGSASRSDIGAAMVVDRFCEAFADAARRQPGLGFLDERQVRDWLAETQGSIRRRAAQDGFAEEDYACTVLGAVIGETCAAFMQIGDGAMVTGRAAADGDGYDWVFWPQHGEFANSTVFVTMAEAGDALQFERRAAADGRSPVQELAMFSDGLERLILDMAARTVHSPSLRPIMTWLAGMPPGCGGTPSDVMLAYLSSDRVNRRTDDDKSLVVATRAELPEPPEPPR